jgi:GH25 family lysozyme M1 (1,4-beta-N-acetylmuramidase)
MTEQYLDTWTRDRNHRVDLPKPGLIAQIRQLISGLDPATRALIPDVSHWNYPIDVAKMVTEGKIDGLICKASDGHQVRYGDVNDKQTYVDDRMAGYVDLAYKARIPAILYHYVQWTVQPNWVTKDIVDWQVSTFVEAAKNKTFAAIALDIEETNTTSSNAGLIASEIYRKLRLLFPTKRIFIYSSMRLYQMFEHLTTWVGTPEVDGKYDLWMAQWTLTQGIVTTWANFRANVLPTINMRVVLPGNATKWQLVQISGDAVKLPGCYGAIDINLFRGDPGEWKNYLSYTTPEPQPEPQPAGRTKFRVTGPDNLRLRSGPGTAYAIVGSLPPGTEVEVQDAGGTNAWIKTDKGWCCVQLSATRYMEVTK